MQPQTQCRKSGTHGRAAMFGKINITFVHKTIASDQFYVFYKVKIILIPTKVIIIIINNLYGGSSRHNAWFSGRSSEEKINIKIH